MTTSNPIPVLKKGIIYSADNGMLICLCCAGASAKYTGKDLSGDAVIPVSKAEAEEWKSAFGTAMKCEGGCTEY